MYSEMLKAGREAFFIKQGQQYVLCRKPEQDYDIDQLNQCLGDPDDSSWYAEKCNAEQLGLVEDIPEEYLLVAHGNPEHLTVKPYGLD